MNRLLQGDVGSGKTVVALYAMLLAVAHGYQAVLMAPTEILARQHALTIRRLLTGSQVRRAELTGGMPAKQRAALLEEIAAGRIDLVVGTQAILQEDVRFAKLGLVVIDEQHKFGVRQRADAETFGPRSALPGDDRHAHPADDHHDALRRPGRLDLERQPAGAAEGQYLSGRRRAPRAVVGVRPQEAPRRAAGIRRRAAGRGVGAVGRREPARDLRVAGQRRVGGLSPGADPRPHDDRGERRRHGPLPPAATSRCWFPRRWSRWASTCPTPR